MISSTSNAQVRQIQNMVKKSKTRKETGTFIVEGIKMFQEIPGNLLKRVYVSESFLKSKDNLSMVKGLSYEVVEDGVFAHMSDTQTPQGILAEVKQLSWSLKDILKQPESAHIMVLETLQDPGNLGTILRAGEGAGVSGIIMNSTTADIYNPKVIRSTMGSIFRVPFVYTEDMAATLQEVKAAGIRLYAAHLSGQNSYDHEDLKKGTGFLIGNEANGLSDDIAAMADRYIRIPMEGKVESLNAAMAASVLMFETARQRRG